MRPYLALLLWLYSGLAAALSAPPPPPAPLDEGESIANISAGNNRFALKLYRAINGGSDNIILSPYSISSAMAMVYAGSAGESEAEIRQSMHFFAPQRPFHRAFGKLDRTLNRQGVGGNDQLAIANALWGQQGMEVNRGFTELLRRNYNAPLQKVDFFTAPEAARQRINRWVEQQTQNRITDLFPVDSIHRDTAMVLANAIYFKGRWATAFNPLQSHQREFTQADGDRVQSLFMGRTDRYRYGHYSLNGAMGGTLLELPYQGNELSMVILLPNRHDQLPLLEQQLGPDRLQRWIASSQMTRVQVAIPKFTTSWDSELSRPLSKLGMPSVFGSKADFSPISKQRSLALDAVIHKAFIEVNEEGTEAAAATGITIRTTSISDSRPKRFIADHPFLYLIRDNSSGTILFLGRLQSPPAASK